MKKIDSVAHVSPIMTPINDYKSNDVQAQMYFRAHLTQWNKLDLALSGPDLEVLFQSLRLFNSCQNTTTIKGVTVK